MLKQDPVTCNYCTMNPVNIKLIAIIIIVIIISVCAFGGKLGTAVSVMHIYTHQRLCYIWYICNFNGEQYLLWVCP